MDESIGVTNESVVPLRKRETGVTKQWYPLPR